MPLLPLLYGILVSAALATAVYGTEPTQPEQRLVEVGGRVKLACPRGKGARLNLREADFRWFYGGRLLLSKPTRSDPADFLGGRPGTVLKENKLVIRNVRFSDAGLYGCFVLLPKPSRWHNYTVLVTRPPDYYGDDYDHDELYYDDFEGDYAAGGAYDGGSGVGAGLVVGGGSELVCDPGPVSTVTSVAGHSTTGGSTTEHSGAERAGVEVSTSRNDSSSGTARPGDGEGGAATEPTATDRGAPGGGEGKRTTERPRAPYFEEPMPLSQVVEAPLGYTVTIQCPVRGFPRPRLRWLFGSRPVSEVKHLSSRELLLGRTCLRLVGLTAYHEGNYSCVAENGLGSVRRSVQLNVTKDALQAWPTIESGWPRNVTALSGGPVTFACPGSWDWEMDVFWVFSYQLEFEIEDMADLSRIHQHAISQYNSRYDISVRDELTIRNATAADAGVYTCLKNNRLGFTYRRARLHIVSEVPPATLSVQPLNASVSPGESVTLGCPAGDPPAGTAGRLTLFWVFSKEAPPRITTVQQLLQAQRDALVSDQPSTTTAQPAALSGPAQDPGRNSSPPPSVDVDFHRLLLTDLAVADTGYYTCVMFSSWTVMQAWTHLTVAEVAALRRPWYLQLWLVLVVPLVLVLLCCAGVTALLCRQRRYRKKIRALTRRVTIEHSPDSLVPRVRIHGCTSDSSCGPGSALLLPSDPRWELDRRRLLLDDTLGEGCFGRVLRGRLGQPDGTSQMVAVKTLKEDYTDSDLLDLLSEMELMKKVGSHTNVVSLLGACTAGGAPLVVLEYARHGNLQNYLRERRETTMYERPFDLVVPSLYDLVQFSFQAARGMEYLANRKCVHRDLAARNVLVADDRIVKIADFGLARDLCHRDYYRKVTDGRLPVKWMAPEALQQRVYTSQSDVWSFGVLLWEIIMMGATPYPGLQSVKELIHSIQEGERLQRPAGCPEPLYAVMARCWQLEAGRRPTFSQLVERLDALVTDLSAEEYVVMASQLPQPGTPLADPSVPPCSTLSQCPRPAPLTH